MTALPLLTPEEIAARAGQELPFLRLPDRATHFSERALRLRRLAAGHAMRDYLMFMAEVAEAQHELLASFGPVALPDAQVLHDAAASGVPPLAADAWPRDPAWRDGLRRMLHALVARVPAGPASQALLRLADADDAWLEQQAERLLTGVMLGLDLAAAPLLGAALQVVWLHLVAQVQQVHGADREAPFGRVDTAGLCPCCGTRPTASVTRLGAQAAGQRYLHCALCSTEWHGVRIKCMHCGATEGIYYEALEAQDGPAPLPTAAPPGAVRAECCSQCGHYLKIVHMEKDPEVDPVADDLATLTLDLLVSAAGLQRHGINLMLLFGDPDAEPEVQAQTQAPDPGGS